MDTVYWESINGHEYLCLSCLDTWGPIFEKSEKNI